MQRGPGLPQWRISSFAEADAWLVNGARVLMTPDGILRVLPGLPTEQSVKLRPADVDRPVAFATPLASPDIEPRCTFNVDSLASVQDTLLQFENWLREARARFALGCDIVRMGPELRHGIFHVSNRGTLVAVLDFRSGRAGVSPHAHPADFAQAQWDKRPAGAGDIPATFIRTSAAELAWAYAHRSDKKLLPYRYLAQTVYFRQPPKVPPHWVSDSQMSILRELAAEPCTLAALQQRTGIAGTRVQRDLACLYFAGAITTTHSKSPRHAFRADSSGPLSSGTGFEPLQERPPAIREITAPAPLGYGARTRALALRGPNAHSGTSAATAV